MSVLKGKRILPRALRHTSPEQTLTLLTLMVATFDTLDTVQDAHLLDASDDLEKLSSGSLEGKSRRAAVEVKTEAFVNAIISPVMVVIGRIELRMVTGMLGLLMERNDLAKVVRSKVSRHGLFLLRRTAWLMCSRVAAIARNRGSHDLPFTSGNAQTSDARTGRF